MQYHSSSLADFSGLLQIDSHSNAFLKLTLTDVMGSIHGTISSANFTQVNIITVRSKPNQNKNNAKCIFKAYSFNFKYFDQRAQ